MLKSISYCMSGQVTQWSKAYDMDFTIILFISSSESKDQVRFSDPDLSVIHCCCKLLTFFTSSSETLSLNQCIFTSLLEKDVISFQEAWH